MIHLRGLPASSYEVGLVTTFHAEITYRTRDTESPINDVPRTIVNFARLLSCVMVVGEFRAEFEFLNRPT